jgi:tetratricopeptide (TPR) repeat protein
MRNSTPAQPVRIEPGQKQERPLAEKEAHPYLVRLAAGDYLHVVAEQRGVDLALRLTAPGGALIAEVDRCKGIRGVERVSEVATEAGDYRIDVVGNERTPKGVYEIRIDERHAATEADRSRVAGERFFLQGEKLRRGNKKEEAIKKYEQALALWQQAGDLERQASVLGAIGRMKDLLDQTEEAVKLYGQAADLFRRVGDPTGQAQALNQYGRLLFRLGRFEEARPLLEEAIRLYFYAGNDPEPEMGRGKLAETRDNFAEALPTTEPIGDRTQLA